MSFEPIGGFPSIILENNNINKKTLESRGFSATNIVSINNIMNSKKKENLFLAFGSDEEDGLNYAIENTFTDNPYDYDRIDSSFIG